MFELDVSAWPSPDQGPIVADDSATADRSEEAGERAARDPGERVAAAAPVPVPDGEHPRTTPPEHPTWLRRVRDRVASLLDRWAPRWAPGGRPHRGLTSLDD